MSWSEEQLLAMEARGRNILVAAAAGSGKTSVLVERIIRRITDEREPVDIDRLLVVTFTNAAAAEMRARIGVALTGELEKRPDSRHLARQLALLGSASISTIHAFCQSLVRQHFHLLDLDPQFRIANDAEIALLKADVLEALFEKKYSENDAAFLSFVEHYSSRHNDDALYDLVLGLYDFSRSHPWPELWLNRLPVSFQLPEGTELDDTPWSAILREKICLELEDCREKLAILCREAAKPGKPAVYIPAFLADRAVLDGLLQAAATSWQALLEAFAVLSFDKLPAVGKETAQEVKEYFQKQRQKIKEKVSGIANPLFACSPTAHLEDMALAAPQVAALAEFTIAFGREFARAKRQKAMVDFHDLEHFCLAVLLDSAATPDDIRPSAVAKALQEKYVEIMVDEYQDTNGVQEMIVRLAGRPDSPNLFFVGDVKQSIYRFRLAEPELFLQKYRQYPAEPDTSLRIDLAQNFRSRAGVLHAVNFLFKQLMSVRTAELEYGEAEQLNPGPDYPPCDGKMLTGPVEVCLIEKNGQSGFERDGTEEEEENGEDKANLQFDEAEQNRFILEARLIVQRIENLMAAGFQVYDKGSKAYRPLTWRDIVILLRSVSQKAGVLLSTLRQAGIPAYAEVDGGYFRETEVQMMLSLLGVIDNPQQDIHLAGVLRSPIGGFSAEELALIRLAKREGSLWFALKGLAEAAANDGQTSLPGRETWEKAAAFLVRLEAWRAISRCKGVPELIWQIYRDTGFYDYVGGMPGGALRQANLRALYDRARQYETTNFRGLFRFLRFIDRMQDKGSDLAVARALGESEDVVRIMSIHKSKGLEFPVVFVADLGKNFNLQDSRSFVLCHKVWGIGPYVTNPDLRYRYPTLARLAIAHKLTMETKAEELRVLYVALTRAREKLILVGSVDDFAKKGRDWSQSVGREEVTLSDGLIASARSYLDWIGPALARHPDGGLLRQEGEAAGARLFADGSAWRLSVHAREELAASEQSTEAACPQLERVRAMAEVETGRDLSWVQAVLGWHYPHSRSFGKAAKLTVSEIKRRMELDEEGEPRLYDLQATQRRPRFIQKPGNMTAAETGTVLHTVMQQLDLAVGVDAASLAKELARMVQCEMLLPEQAAAVDTEGIIGFFSSALGQRMLASPQLRRETPFSLSLPACRFYPELDDGDEIFVQGVIDVLFDEGDDLVLLDYKTDRETDAGVLVKKYAVQLAVYAEAVEKIWKKEVKETYLYSFSLGQALKIK